MVTKSKEEEQTPDVAPISEPPSAIQIEEVAIQVSEMPAVTVATEKPEKPRVTIVKEEGQQE